MSAVNVTCFPHRVRNPAITDFIQYAFPASCSCGKTVSPADTVLRRVQATMRRTLPAFMTASPRCRRSRQLLWSDAPPSIAPCKRPGSPAAGCPFHCTADCGTRMHLSSGATGDVRSSSRRVCGPAITQSPSSVHGCSTAGAVPVRPAGCSVRAGQVRRRGNVQCARLRRGAPGPQYPPLSRSGSMVPPEGDHPSDASPAQPCSTAGDRCSRQGG